MAGEKRGPDDRDICVVEDEFVVAEWFGDGVGAAGQQEHRPMLHFSVPGA